MRRAAAIAGALLALMLAVIGGLLVRGIAEPVEAVPAAAVAANGPTAVAANGPTAVAANGPTAVAADGPAVVARGRYLALAGNCRACTRQPACSLKPSTAGPAKGSGGA